MPTRSTTSPIRRRISARVSPRFSGPKASSVSTVVPTICLLGSWSSVPTTVDSSLTVCSATGRPPTRTSPVTSAR